MTALLLAAKFELGIGRPSSDQWRLGHARTRSMKLSLCNAPADGARGLASVDELVFQLVR